MGDCDMIRQGLLIGIAILIALSLLVIPTGAVYPPNTYLGEVVTLTPAQQTMGISTAMIYECNPAGGTMVCTWVSANRTVLQGIVPDPAVFSIVKVSDTVEASQVMEDTRQWVSIARIFPTQGTYLATDLIGDPTYLRTPLAGGYQVLSVLTPDCLQCSDSVCQAQSATITVNQSGTTVFEATLKPGEDGEFIENDPDARVRLTFIRGETLPAGCPSKELPLLSNVRLKSVFIISIDSNNENRVLVSQIQEPISLALPENTSLISDTQKSMAPSPNSTLPVNISLISDTQKTPAISPSVPLTEHVPHVGDTQSTTAMSPSFLLSVLIVTGLFFAFRKK